MVRAGLIADGEVLWATGGYTVIAELNPVPKLYYEPRRTANRGPWLYWTYTEPGKTYTVEWTPALAPTQWRPVNLHPTQIEPGAGGLESARMIFLWNDNFPPAFYRLRVDPTP